MIGYIDRFNVTPEGEASEPQSIYGRRSAAAHTRCGPGRGGKGVTHAAGRGGADCRYGGDPDQVILTLRVIRRPRAVCARSTSWMKPRRC